MDAFWFYFSDSGIKKHIAIILYLKFIIPKSLFFVYTIGLEVKLTLKP